jgi:hypothetical protein
MGTASASNDSATHTYCLTDRSGRELGQPDAWSTRLGARLARLRIHVERFNPALRLYERLGFWQIDDRGVYLFMAWREEPSA